MLFISSGIFIVKRIGQNHSLIIWLSLMRFSLAYLKTSNFDFEKPLGWNDVKAGLHEQIFYNEVFMRNYFLV